MDRSGSTPGSEPRHRLLFELGRGGMGTVYLALARGPAGFHKLKVVKQLRYELAEDLQFLNMFMDEARLSARLNHPNIVQTNEVGFDGKNYFIEMEYLEGQSLDALLRRSAKRGSLPRPMALWILAQCCAGLHYAHELRDHDGTALEIVHRDVSPHNVFVTYEGAVKVLDFGIAKAIDSSSETRTGVVKGKATYMAPEQALRARVDRRADVFAVGVMLWQVISDRRMYEGLSDGEIFVRLERGQVPSLMSVSPDVPPALAGIVDRALAIAPDDRFSTAAELQVALEEYLESETKHVGPRQVAALMNQLFTDRREAVRGEIEARMRGSTFSTEVDSSVPRLEQAPGVRATITGPTSPGMVQLAVTPTSHRTPSDDTRAQVPSAKLRIERTPAGATPAIGSVVRDSTRPDARLPRPERRVTKYSLFGLLGLAALGVLVSRMRAPTPSPTPNPAPPAPSAAAAGAACVVNADCAALAGTSVCSEQGFCVAPRGCTRNAECEGKPDEPALCIRAEGRCVPLASPDCHVLAEKDDLANDATLWLGTMFPTKGPDGPAFGLESEHAVELGRRELARTVGGLTGRVRRPVAIVACDDSTDPSRAARHLVEDVHVPAIIGFRDSKEVIDLAMSELIPHGVLTVASLNSSPLVTQIPQPPGPRLVLRTTVNSTQFGRVLAALVSDLLAPKAWDAAHHSTQPLRLAFVRPGTGTSQTIGSELFERVQFNGKSAVENGSNYREIVYTESGREAPASAFASTVSELASFRPSVIAIAESVGMTEGIIEPLEKQWPPNVPRPFYALTGVSDTYLFNFLGKSKERRSRIFALGTKLLTATNAQFVMRYNQSFTPQVAVTDSPGSCYDAFYLLVYAAMAAGESLHGGLDLAKASARLTPPGVRIDVGPTQILAGFDALRAGQNIDLNGALTPLDLDGKTGESPADFVVLCPGVNAQGVSLEAVESGMAYDATTGQMVGTLRCP